MSGSQAISVMLLVIAVLGAPSLTKAPPLPRNLDRIQLQTEATQSDWTLSGGNYKGWRYSGLTQINKRNVENLQVAWRLGAGGRNVFETRPLVINGVMYITTPADHILAVNAKTGQVYWRYALPLPKSLRLCCGAVNRGVAAGCGKIFVGTPDCHLVALYAATGIPAWEIESASYREGYGYTSVPVIVGNKVIIGVSGNHSGGQGFIDAYDADTGKRLWQFGAIPERRESRHVGWEANSWKRGGAPEWMPVTYDPETNTLFAGGGDPGPEVIGTHREVIQLFTRFLVALDANTGKLKRIFPQNPDTVGNIYNATGCPIAYDPVRKRIFISAIAPSSPDDPVQGCSTLPYRMAIPGHAPDETTWHLAAIDVENKQVLWDVASHYPLVAGVTCTASGLVITGTLSGRMLIFDAENGKLLYAFNAPSGWCSAPVVYAVDGREYIAFANGSSGYSGSGDMALNGMSRLNAMFAFTLPEKSENPLLTPVRAAGTSKTAPGGE